MPISDHVAFLRAAVGNAMLHLPSVAVVCRDDEGRLLLVLETDSAKWSIPGGMIEPGESPEEAVEREVREETGLDVTVRRLVTAVGGEEFQKTYANGDRLSFVSLVYEADIVGGRLFADGTETADVRWFDDAEIDALPFEGFLRSLRQRAIV